MDYESFNERGSTQPVAKLANFIISNFEELESYVSATTLKNGCVEAAKKYPNSLLMPFNNKLSI